MYLGLWFAQDSPISGTNPRLTRDIVDIPCIVAIYFHMYWGMQ